MGTDIHGWVEIRFDYWDPVIFIDRLVERNYEIFASFFDVRNRQNLKSLAGRRGMPEDVSREVKQNFDQWGVDAHSPSWILWSEIAVIDWNETLLDNWRIHLTEPLPDGTFLDNPTISKLEILPHWKLLFSMMQQLAEMFGGENVRLVVWFDN